MNVLDPRRSPGSRPLRYIVAFKAAGHRFDDPRRGAPYDAAIRSCRSRRETGAGRSLAPHVASARPCRLAPVQPDHPEADDVRDHGVRLCDLDGHRRRHAVSAEAVGTLVYVFDMSQRFRTKQCRISASPNSVCLLVSRHVVHNVFEHVSVIAA
jgi:hypothetical protein